MWFYVWIEWIEGIEASHSKEGYDLIFEPRVEGSGF